MTQKTVILLTDDLDGSEAVETVTFGLDGQSYEIDLSEENAADLRERVSEWSQHARKGGGRAGARGAPRPRSSTPPASALKEDVAAIREWARNAGHEVSPRGRIAQKIREAYHAAMG
ncbi:MAG TPA: Lsr2 family protein [Frankiaceae bacterium]|nr:Lsr2 family protein [Frankiaceae bacterium]